MRMNFQKNQTFWQITTVIFWMVVPAFSLHAAEALVAVAANFTAPAQKLATLFAQETGHTVRFSFGSTGKLYAQIVNGAPFEVFLAADEERPRRLAEEGLGISESRFPYAFGRLVLYSPQAGLVDSEGKVLEQGNFRRLAIANAATAPYGKATEEVLRQRGLLAALQSKLVRGENISQALQFVKSGNAELGFVALSQVLQAQEGSTWVVPPSLHSPIRQDSILLNKGSLNPAAQAFVQFLRSPKARQLIEDFGYGLE